MYGTLIGFRQYHTERGNSAPTDADDAVATAALLRGSDYIRMRYVPMLLAGYDITFIPPGFTLPLTEEGAYIAAAIELTSPGFFSKSFTPSQQKVLTGVGNIRWTVTNKDGTFAYMPTSTLLEAIFYPYIRDPDAVGVSLASIGRGRY